MRRTLSIALALSSLLVFAPACDEGNSDSAEGNKVAAQPEAKDPGKRDADRSDKPADAAPAKAVIVDDADEEFAGFDPRVVKAAKIAREIEKEPKDAETVLAQNDMDREALDTLMFEIARDPDLTGPYRIARGM